MQIRSDQAVQKCSIFRKLLTESSINCLVLRSFINGSQKNTECGNCFSLGRRESHGEMIRSPFSREGAAGRKDVIVDEFPEDSSQPRTSTEIKEKEVKVKEVNLHIVTPNVDAYNKVRSQIKGTYGKNDDRKVKFTVSHLGKAFNIPSSIKNIEFLTLSLLETTTFEKIKQILNLEGHGVFHRTMFMMLYGECDATCQQFYAKFKSDRQVKYDSDSPQVFQKSLHEMADEVYKYYSGQSLC